MGPSLPSIENLITVMRPRGRTRSHNCVKQTILWFQTSIRWQYSPCSEIA
jgi:hypothetical protein